MKKITLFFVSALIMASHIASASPVIGDEHVVWQREPIEVTLPVGKERLVTFPSKVALGYALNLLPSSTLRVENDNMTLYLLAKKPFATQRAEAKLSNGQIVLLDLSAKPQADTHPIDIVLPKLSESTVNKQSYAGSANVSYMSMMRFAIKTLYPSSSVPASQATNMTRFPMDTTHVAPLFYDGSILALPLAGWRSGDLYITAVMLKNLLNKPLKLDPKLVCGHWQSSVFYPQNGLALHGARLNGDTTTLFLISTRPFANAMRDC